MLAWITFIGLALFTMAMPIFIPRLLDLLEYYIPALRPPGVTVLPREPETPDPS